MEVNHAKVYCEIQALRFMGRVEIIFDDLPSPCENWVVPRLILQPVIENAFKHCLEGMLEQGLLHIGFQHYENELCITVEDNGQSLTDEKLTALAASLLEETEGMEVTGIHNINRRLRLKFNKDSGIRVCRSKSGGLAAVLKIRLHKEEDGNVPYGNPGCPVWSGYGSRSF